MFDAMVSQNEQWQGDRLTLVKPGCSKDARVPSRAFITVIKRTFPSQISTKRSTLGSFWLPVLSTLHD
jgi:hypothetical protein